MLTASASSKEAAGCMEQIAQWIQGELKKAGSAPTWKKFLVVGPADAGIAKINNIYRKVLYMKHPDYQILVQVKDFLEKRLRETQRWKKDSVQFDFNPLNPQ